MPENLGIAASLMLAACLTLSACSWSASIGRPPLAATPAPAKLEMRDGQVIEEPLTPIETVIEGLSQADKVRTLTRKLAR
jgi:hypothetical protein